MSVKTQTRKVFNAPLMKSVKLQIRARTNAPDNWLGLAGEDLDRRLVTTGSQCRSTVHDILGRTSTRGLNMRWAKGERWKEIEEVWTKRPRNRLRHLDSLLYPLIASERLEVEVKGKNGAWLPLSLAAATTQFVV